MDIAAVRKPTEKEFTEFISNWWPLLDVPSFTVPWTTIQAAIWDCSEQYYVWSSKYNQPPGRLKCTAQCCHITLRKFSKTVDKTCYHQKPTLNPKPSISIQLKQLQYQLSINKIPNQTTHISF